MQKITLPTGTTIKTSIENDMLVFEFECEEPIKWIPKDNEVIYIASPIYLDYFNETIWHGSLFAHQQAYEIGLIFQTKEKAIERGKMLAKFLNETK